MLAARRGFGTDAARDADRAFVEAVHWALYVERIAPFLAELRQVVATDPPQRLDQHGRKVPVLTGLELQDFIAHRGRARTRLAELEATLFPDDEDPDGQR